MSLKVWATLVSSELFRNLAHCLGTKKKKSNTKKMGLFHCATF